MDISEKWYLIVGGSSGIGLAAACKLAELNGHIVLVSSNAEKLKKSFQQLPGRKHQMFCCDLKDPMAVSEIFSFLKCEKIRLDGMIYSAGVSPLCLLKDQTPELMQQVFAINFFSFLETVRYFQMEEISNENASIVAVGSITAKGAGYRQTLYGSSKAAMISAIKLMAKELLNRGIRINCVSPGVADTDILDNLRQKSTNLDEKICANQPLGIIPPAQIAEVLAFLLSPAANYLTGMEWVYDGGALLK